MGKKKSKCKSNAITTYRQISEFSIFPFSGCCIYKKPLEFGESSSEEDEDECDHCYGHVEKKKKNHKDKDGSGDGMDEGEGGSQDNHNGDEKCCDS